MFAPRIIQSQKLMGKKYLSDTINRGHTELGEVFSKAIRQRNEDGNDLA